MKWTKKQSSPLLELFRRQPLFLGKKKKEIPVMNSLRGNPKAKILCIAPPPSAGDYERNLPLADKASQIFHNILAREGISTQNDMLVVSCSRYGVKPSKGSCSPVFDFVAHLVKEQQFDLFVCIGDAAFRHIFAFGRKPNMQTLIGHVVFLQQLNHVPLFTFPSLDGLAIPQDAKGSTWRWHQKSLDRMTKIAREFARLTKVYVK